MLLLFMLLGCDDPEVRRCNGASHLCERTLDRVAFAATHNAMSSEERGWLFPNQGDAIPTQLEQGIRGLNIDLYRNEDDELVFCHSYCELGEQNMVEGFSEIREFVESHPDDVLLMTFESHISAADTSEAMTDAGLDVLAYAHELGTDWPTLRQLLDEETPVIAFTSNADGGPAWLMDQWTHWLDTPYGQASLAEVDDYETSCIEERGEPTSATLFNINHFMTAPIANPEDAGNMNTWTRLAARSEACENLTGRFPNQILVDFANLGDVVGFVEHLNRE